MELKFAVPTPIIFVIFPFLIGGLLVNSLIVWAFLSNKKIGYHRALISTAIAYFFLASFGLCITFYTNISTNFLWFMLYYLLAVIIQGLVMFPYFSEFQFNKFKLLFVSFLANTVVFGFLTYMTFYKVGVVQHYVDLVRISLEQQGLSF